jgi:hypothetical protein
MINIWGTTFLVGPFLGLALAGYILDGTKSWRAVFGVLTGLYGLSIVVLLHFARETYFNRSAHTSQTSRAKSFFAIGITTTIDAILHAPPYMMANVPAASMRFAGVIGAILGFAFGYFFNEWIYHGTNGARKPHWRNEYRLHDMWVPVTSMICGLLVYGLTLNYQVSWVGLALSWILVNVGLVGSTVAVTAFAL